MEFSGMDILLVTWLTDDKKLYRWFYLNCLKVILIEPKDRVRLLKIN